MDITRRNFVASAALTGASAAGIAAAAATLADTEQALAVSSVTPEVDKETGEEVPTMNYTEPYLLTLKPSCEMNVLWLAKEMCEGYVEYGPTPALGERVEAKPYAFEGLRSSAKADGYDADPENNPELEVCQLIATLEGLEPGSVVYYRAVTVGSLGEEVGERYYFKTAPLPGGDFKFALLSDMQMKVRTKETVKVLGQADKDFIVFAGDMCNTPWKAGEWFNVEGCYEVEGEDDRGFFECLNQTSENTHLLQFMPVFPCPGNHEFDDQRVCTDKDFATDDSKWTWKIYMQMFRPLYPEQDYSVNGKRWYSVDYGDMHLCSLSVARWNAWDGFEYPGWITKDDISADSAQVGWLVDDLKHCDARYKWVTQHWHMLNRGEDGYFPVSTAIEDPENPGAAIYPDGDNCWNVLRPIYEAYGVDAVNFGHSHVYERYYINGVNYIEAASIGNNYRNTADPFHPSGNLPIIEENNFRSFMIVTADENGMQGHGVQASVETSDVETEVGYCGRVFETFTIAE